MSKKDGDAFLASVRPELRAGGYSRDDSSVNFFLRVNALLRPEMTVVDLGAGRGTTLLGEQTFARELYRLQGKVRKVIGIDIDNAIAEHPYLDERHIVRVGDPYPVASESVDLVVCDWVFEHVAEPDDFVREIGRILKPGGWVCARTPNRWGYVGIATNIVPNAKHQAVLSRVWPERSDVDVFPTVYRLNSKQALSRFFPAAVWENYSYFDNPSPKYHGNNAAMFALIGLYQTIVPKFMRTDLFVFIRKKPIRT